MKYIMLDYAEYRELEKIKETHKKNMEALEGHIAIPEEDYEEYKQLKHILDELEKWLNGYLNREFPDCVDLKLYMFCEMVMDKLKGLRGRENENKM